MVQKKKVKQLQALKSKTKKSEDTISGIAHKLLNDPKLVEVIKLGSKSHYEFIKLVREYADVIALHLNTPTKDDVANVAQLVKQLEEKIDSLEEKLKDAELGAEKNTPEHYQEHFRTYDKDRKKKWKDMLTQNMFDTSVDNSLGTKELLERLIDRRR
ncbi:hypothetical protein [Alkalihalobacterium chitinilyticum]|uniref:Uncharacterized protein n=1 Tax=Alkalihalobacterium chitinilyticum TaxID=2980103 RepID=A0ABT5VD68_9BACI|nr:hypothetical protein [Alkalihalobacterium chitinilyticum]MDE5413235.1 hypothetical protein [Alkalihalobacterium chitinilyticum]